LRNPIFVVQTFLAILLLLFSSPILDSIDLQAVHFGQEFIFPSTKISSLIHLFAQINPIQNWIPQFTFAMPEASFPHRLIPNGFTADLTLDISSVVLLLIFSGLLWVIGNLFLLRKTQEVNE